MFCNILKSKNVFTQGFLILFSYNFSATDKLDIIIPYKRWENWGSQSKTKAGHSQAEWRTLLRNKCKLYA